MKSYILILTYISCVLVRAQTPEPAGFVEQWVLSKDRAATLKLLIPGTDDYFFYHALHYQHTGEKEKFTTVMKEWDAAVSQKKIARSPRYTVMENRGIILDYKDKPSESIDRLSKLLNLDLDHQRPIPPEDAVIPSSLDQNTISSEAFKKEAALEKYPYREYYDHILYQELKNVPKTDRVQRLWFLKNMDHTGAPGTKQLFLTELQHKSKPSFSKIPGREHLLLDQLRWLEQQHPPLREQSAFISAVIKRMRPGNSHYLLHHPVEKKAWLKETWNYVSDLPPVHNSLKAHILYHLLKNHQANGEYPEDLLLAYLAIPRSNSGKLIQQRNTKNTASLRKDYTSLTTLPPVSNDYELLRTYLLKVLAKKEDVTEYTQRLPEELLNQLHVEAKLLSGANPETWGNKISPESFKKLREQTEVSIALKNKLRYGANDDVSLLINLKNTPSLDIQIYQIDSLSHISRTGTDPDVSIKLNGLVPHQKFTETFQKAPLLRHLYRVPLPQLKGRGIWIVECISKGVSCRALIKKGQFQMLISDTADGQSAMVIDENQSPLPQAHIKIQGITYKSDKDGKIKIPLASSARIDKAIVHIPDSNGSGLAEAHSIQRRALNHTLSLKAGTDREQLIAGKTATLLIRPLLLSNGLPISIKQLKKTSLHINATLRGNINTELTSKNININEQGITSCNISIPEDVRSISITLNGEIEVSGRSEPTKLNASTTMKINGASDTHLLAQPLLALTDKGWIIDLLGRNGEPLAKRSLEIEMQRYGFENSVKSTLRTDTDGKIHLGDLNGIEFITIGKTDFSNKVSNYLITKDASFVSTYHVLKGEDIHITTLYPIELQHYQDYSCLYRHHGDTTIPVQDMSQHLNFADGQISITNLPVGHYTLKTPFSTLYDIHVIKGKLNGPWISNSSSSFEYDNPSPLEVSGLQNDGDNIRGSVSGTDGNTQLLIIGTRYFTDGRHLSLVDQFLNSSLLRWEHGFSGNEWLNGRELSDEYRYIIERRQAKQFPGNMLPRPGLILNRWKHEDSNTFLSEGGGGRGGSTSFGKEFAKKLKKRNEKPKAGSSTIFPSYDFLSRQSVIKTKIKLADDGTFSLPAKDFAHCQSISVVAYNAKLASSHTLPLPEKKLLTRERRLDRNLDPQKHYMGSSATAVLKKDAVAEIRNVLDADWRAYTSLGHVHDYFHTNADSHDLRAFALLMQWPTLTEKQRSKFANLLASHEFHLFAYFKDRKWFDQNIKPVLEHKRHRTFIDNFLLGQNLEDYLEPWKYEQLNAAEKALLARALPSKRNAIVRDLQHRFNLSNPTPEQETQLFASALRQNSLALRDRLGFSAQELSWLEDADQSVAGALYMQQKLKNIIIPVVEFENTPLAEAIDFLRMRSREIDPEPDPAHKGINFSIRGSQLTNTRIKEFKLRNIPLGTLLQYICDSTRTRYRLTNKGVEIQPLDALEVTDFSTRKIIVPPDFIAKMSVGAEDDMDPFGGGDTGGGTLGARPSAKEILLKNGIAFPEGAFANYIPSTNTLIIHNTTANIDIVDQLTSALNAPSPHSSRSRLTSRSSGGGGGLLPGSNDSNISPFGSSDYEPPELPNQIRADAFAGFDEGSGESDTFPVTPATPVEPEDLTTHIWSESNYYRHPNLEDGPTILPNRFWIEFASHDGKSPFLSARFPECTGSTASMLIALAVLDLPFEGEKPEAQIENLTLKVKANSRMLLFYRDTRETNKVVENSPLLVQQKFFRYGDRTRTDDAGQKEENPVTGEFLAGVPYTASFIITNPTGTARELQVLTQIPRGSISLGLTPDTEARDIKLDAHSTTRIEYGFYFPEIGVFPHFPAHVLERGTVLAFAKPQPMKVLEYNALKDTRSWAAIARDGTDEAVLARMEKINLHQTSLNSILWRLSNKEFYQSVMSLLKSRLYYDSNVYAYGFKHADSNAVASYLENADIADQLGSYLSSSLITLDNRERGIWENLEFAPTINARQHKFQGYYQFLNTEAQEQYLDVLDAIAWKPSPSQDDLLTLSYQLFLQDRIPEALEAFARVNRDQTEAKMQYDYMHCYGLFYQEKTNEAGEIAKRWEGTKSTLWKKRFSAVSAQAAEIAGLNTPDTKDSKNTLPPTPSLEMQSKGSALAFDVESIKSATLSLYAVDLEVLFSENPFLDKHTELNPPIQPNHVMDIKFPEGKNTHQVTLPENMQLGNVLAMVRSESMQQVLALDSQAIRLTQNLPTKTLRVISEKDNKPLPRSYVKIYVETTDGETLFLKDGYTDLRGQFQYESHTKIMPYEINRYAIFCSHKELGSKILITE